MSTTAFELVKAFGTLPETERDAVISELLLQYPIGGGDLSDAALEELAEELFLSYDDAEAADATTPR